MSKLINFFSSLKTRYANDVLFWLFYFTARILLFIIMFGAASTLFTLANTLMVIASIFIYVFAMYFIVKTGVEIYQVARRFFEQHTTK